MNVTVIRNVLRNNVLAATCVIQMRMALKFAGLLTCQPREVQVEYHRQSKIFIVWIDICKARRF